MRECCELHRAACVSASSEVLERAAGIRLAVFDVDGVLTDGHLLLGPDGAEFKSFHVRDGHGLVMLREAGIEIGIITGRRSRVVAERMHELGVAHVLQGIRDKSAALADMVAATDVELAEVAYAGDDLPDLPPMRMVGLPIAVADAAHPVVEASLWTTSLGGGCGAAREICDLILAAQHKLQQFVASP